MTSSRLLVKWLTSLREHLVFFLFFLFGSNWILGLFFGVLASTAVREFDHSTAHTPAGSLSFAG